MIKAHHLLIALLFVIQSNSLPATVISGKVTDTKGTVLPFSIVYLQGTTIGATANIEGYYQLILSPGHYNISFRCMGYEIKTLPVDVGMQPLTLNASLAPNRLELAPVVISARSEDPAYPIIRKAIKKRKFHLEQVKSYSCNVYMKGVQKIKSYPKKFFGQEITPDMIGLTDTVSGIVYLSESVSKYSFEQPDKVKEEMISSKVSGSNKAFSFNQSADRIMNFYEPMVLKDFLSQRGFISPIAPTALLSYKYHLAGTFRQNGQLINKIEIKPIRVSDPAFTGVVYIADSTWRLDGLEAYITKQNGLMYVDTVHITQTFSQTAPDIWMPVTSKVSFNLNIFGFIGDGYFVQSNTAYDINTAFGKHYFTNEELKVTAEANKKDTAYWNHYRPVPLTKDEQKDYVVKDSMQKRKESKPYLDSIDHKINKFKWSNVLFGYDYNKSFEKKYFSITAPIQTFQFNSVEGLNVGTGFEYTHRIDDGEEEDRLNMNGKIRYGFSNHQASGDAGFTYGYSRTHFARIKFNAGSEAVQFNEKEPITPLLNTFYALLNHDNFMKLYRKTFVHAEHRIEICNGFILNTGLEYAHRDTLSNTTEYSFFRRDKQYTPNNPASAGSSIAPGNALTFNADAVIRFAQHYATRPGRKIVLGSKYPALTLGYRKGITGLLNSSVNYDLVTAGLSDYVSLGLLGNLQYKLNAGKYLNNKNVYFMDYTHFAGNQTIFTSHSLAHFNDLPYYAYSTDKLFFEAHVQQNFGGFIVNKFPLIRRLRLREYAALHLLKTDAVQYIEVSAGLSRGNILPLKIEGFKTFINGTAGTIGLRLAVPIL